MKVRLIALLLILTVGVSFAQQKQKKGAKQEKQVTKTELKTQKDKVSYTIGVDIGRNLKAQGIEIENSAFMQGIKDGIAKDSMYLLTMDEIREVMTQFEQEMQARQMVKMQELADKNLKQETAFLAENAKKDSIKTTASGLQYKVIREGMGTAPSDSDTVVVNYIGKLIDGTEFDNSYKRGKPATFPVGGVIKGWTEALQMMKPGSKYELYIPSQLAYGERGAGERIPPNSTLIFEVELIEVK